MKKNAPESFPSSMTAMGLTAKGLTAPSKLLDRTVPYNPAPYNNTALGTATEVRDAASRSSQRFEKASTAESDKRRKQINKPADEVLAQHALVDLENESFNLADRDLVTTWSSNSRIVCCLNAYPNGVTLSVHDNSVPAPVGPEQSETEASNSPFLPNQFHLRFRDTRDYQVPTGKYFLHKENFKLALEKHLMQLHQKGLLSSTTIYFGTVTDPFMSFAKKFPVTMACLEVLEQYKPANLVVQTRSPMVIAALPSLKYLAQSSVVVIPIETKSESAVVRYMPGQPKISERLVAAQGLRQQGITVNLSASPLLPYGNITRNAWEFAAMLVRNSDYVTFGSLASGVPGEETHLKNLDVARKLVADGQELWLRPHCYRYLYSAVKVLAPEKLKLPVQASRAGSQLDLFAA